MHIFTQFRLFVTYGMDFIKMFEDVDDDKSIISLLQDDTRSRDPKKSDSAKAALKERPTLLYLRAQKNGSLYRDKSYNKAFSTFNIDLANELAPKVDAASRDASKAIGLTVLADKAHGKDSKQYAKAMLEYLNLQEIESQMWDKFVIALGHNRSKNIKVFSDDMSSMSLEGLSKLLPGWPKRWLTELANGNPPTGDAGKRKLAVKRMEKVLKMGKSEDVPTDDMSDADAEAAASVPRKATRKIIVPADKGPKKPTETPEEPAQTAGSVETKPADKDEKKIEALDPDKPTTEMLDSYAELDSDRLKAIADDLSKPQIFRNAAKITLASREPAKTGETGKEPRPTEDKLEFYDTYSDEGLKKLATEDGFPRLDRNTARAILTKRGFTGYEEPDYDADIPVKHEVPLTVTGDDDEPDNKIGQGPAGSHMSQITGSSPAPVKPIMQNPVSSNPHVLSGATQPGQPSYQAGGVSQSAPRQQSSGMNTKPCRLCGLPENDPIHY